MAEIISIGDLLHMDLHVPDYQRPYKWTVQNIRDLLNDIDNAISDAGQYRDGFRYRIGTVILYRNENDHYEIVDGQQRIISLILLKKCTDPSFSCPILKEAVFDSEVSQANIRTNYTFIREWFSMKESSKEAFSKAFDELLEAVVIHVGTLPEAFQLFDSQNTRGRELDPHDLLKAYHLREMKQQPYETEYAVRKWEAQDTRQIRELFDLYLFPIRNWSSGMKSKPFTAKEIDSYKGISESSGYTYALRAGKAMPYFQITEPFIAGNDFFEMTDHYIRLLGNIRTEIENNPSFSVIKEILNDKTEPYGYAKTLFCCALLAYYDRFHNFDEMAVKKLFLWAFMLRVDMLILGFGSVNRYAVGNPNDHYTNRIAMFMKIKLARTHHEISGLQIIVRNNSKKPDKYEQLCQRLKSLLGVTEA